MSRKYGLDDHVPNSVLADRIDQLVRIIIDRHVGHRFTEFSMRIPAEPDRDADLVLSEAAKRLRAMPDQAPRGNREAGEAQE